jgi:hypothetical protein
MTWDVIKVILTAFALLATIGAVIGFIRVYHERKQKALIERRKHERRNDSKQPDGSLA